MLSSSNRIKAPTASRKRRHAQEGNNARVKSVRSGDTTLVPGLA